MTDQAPTAAAIRRLMLQRGIRSVAALEDGAGLRRDAVRNILLGRSKSPRGTTLSKLASYLDVTVDELAGRGEDRGAADLPGTAISAAAGWSVGVIRLSGDLTAYFQAERLLWVTVPDDTMAPTMQESDIAIIDAASSTVDRAGIYAIGDRKRYVLRRCIPGIDGTQVNIRSDNPNVRVEDSASTKEVAILGRVVGRLSKM